MKKLLIIQHQERTTPGTTVEWAQSRRIQLQTWWPDREEAPPSNLQDYIGIVICGGTMDTFEEDKYPWLKREKNFLKVALQTKTKIFGLCLGSQLLAEVLGGHVYQHPGWEIGFVPVTNPNTGETLTVFHWHHCTFDLPPQAKLLFTNDYCRNQAFAWSDHVIATQFHPESTREWIEERANKVSLQYEGEVQTKEKILTSLAKRNSLQEWYFEKLDALFLNSAKSS